MTNKDKMFLGAKRLKNMERDRQEKRKIDKYRRYQNLNQTIQKRINMQKTDRKPN